MSRLIFKTFSHFQLVFVYGVREYSHFIDLRDLLYVNIQGSLLNE